MQGLVQIYRKAALGSDPETHLTTQGNLILCLKSSLPKKVIQMCSCVIDLSET